MTQSFLTKMIKYTDISQLLIPMYAELISPSHYCDMSPSDTPVLCTPKHLTTKHSLAQLLRSWLEIYGSLIVCWVWVLRLLVRVIQQNW